MALFRWEGNGAGTKTDWDDGRNWLDPAGANYVQARYPGTIPGVHDDVIYDTALGGGALSTAGYDAVAAGDETLNRLAVGPAYNGTIGAAGAGGQIRINAADIYIQSGASGDVHLEGGTLGAGLENITVLGFTALNALYLYGHIGDLFIEKGAVILDAATVFAADASITTRYATAILADVTLTIPAGVTLPTTGIIVCFGGRINCAAETVELYVYGGEWTQAADLMKLGMTGGQCIWNDGDITAAVLEGGTLNGSGSVISRVVDHIYVYRGATLNLNNGVLGSITIGTVHEAWGGVTTWQPGDRLIQV